MNCPKCNNSLKIANTKGIEIDYCPNCLGVWLDRGELEKIIERSNEYGSQYTRENNHNNQHNDHHEKHYDSHQNYGYGHNTKHKKGFLSELFDF